MRERPKSRYDNDDGTINVSLLLREKKYEDYPEVGEWEREYSNECDRLSTKGVPINSRHRWGRWYLKHNCLYTPIVKPRIGAEGSLRSGYYDIPIDRLNEDWVSHMGEKNWMGKQGLRNLERAIKDITSKKV